jgi:hypothetical protein
MADPPSAIRHPPSRGGVEGLQRTLVHCARAHWGLAVVYLALPFVLGVRAGAPAFAGFLVGAVIIAVVGLLLYGSSRYAARQPGGLLGVYLLRWVAGGGWVVFALLALAAVWLIVEQSIK